MLSPGRLLKRLRKKTLDTGAGCGILPLLKHGEAEMTQFDFGDGPVPAHQHPNGGGWVADTAYVSDTAYVGLNAQVSGNARVSGDAWVSGDTVMT